MKATSGARESVGPIESLQVQVGVVSFLMYHDFINPWSIEAFSYASEDCRVELDRGHASPMILFVRCWTCACSKIFELNVRIIITVLEGGLFES